MEQVIAVRAGGVSQIDDGHMVAVVFLGDAAIVAVEVAFGVRGDEAHATGTGIFQVWIEEIGGLSNACRADHQAMDVIVIHQRVAIGRCIVKQRSPSPADNQPLDGWEIFSLTPFFRFEPDFRIGISDLLL